MYSGAGRNTKRNSKCQAQDAKADSLEASQEWGPPALGETTTRDITKSKCI